MSFFANNIKLLRKRKHLSQDSVAKELNLTRSSLSGYENSTAQAPYDVLIELSKFYSISTDLILKKDLSDLSESALDRLEQNGKFDLNGNQLRTLVTTSNDTSKTNAELVPLHAVKVYPHAHDDPDYISELPQMKLPFLSDNKRYRAFPISDESMPPLSKGSYVIGEYCSDWNLVEDGEYYIIITEKNGVSFKQLFKLINDKFEGLQMCSVDPFFPPFNIEYNEIIEIWKFVGYISRTLEDRSLNDKHILYTVKELQRKMEIIEHKLK
jgi:transcriptional regulator with XRE-family HTH domain